MNIKAFNEDCVDLIGSQTFKNLTQGKKVCIVTDPPFNVGYHYNSYKDDMKEEDYFEWLAEILTSHGLPFVVIHYPEALYKLAFQVGLFPERVVSWVYNSNTPRQHRDIAFFKIKPDFDKVRQPYKNIGDKRCERLMSEGTGGGTHIRLVERQPSQERVQGQDVRPPMQDAIENHGKHRGRASRRLCDIRPIHGKRNDWNSLPKAWKGLHWL